jgi:hypothetical protein
MSPRDDYKIATGIFNHRRILPDKALITIAQKTATLV